MQKRQSDDEANAAFGSQMLVNTCVQDWVGRLPNPSPFAMLECSLFYVCISLPANQQLYMPMAAAYSTLCTNIAYHHLLWHFTHQPLTYCIPLAAVKVFTCQSLAILLLLYQCLHACQFAGLSICIIILGRCWLLHPNPASCWLCIAFVTSSHQLLGYCICNITHLPIGWLLFTFASSFQVIASSICQSPAFALHHHSSIAHHPPSCWPSHNAHQLLAMAAGYYIVPTIAFYCPVVGYVHNSTCQPLAIVRPPRYLK